MRPAAPNLLEIEAERETHGGPDSSEIEADMTNLQSGCGLLMTEFTSADGLSRMREAKRRRYLTFYDDEHPIGAQLFGSNAETLAEAARIVQDTGFDTVDLNLGCPAKRVVGCNGGSGLLQRPAEDRGDISNRPASGHDSLYREVSHGMERFGDCVCGTGADGRGRGLECRGAACSYAGAGLQRSGAVGVDRSCKAGGEDPCSRQRRHPHSRGCGCHGGADRLRCGDDRPGRGGESLDFQTDCPVHRHGSLRPGRRLPIVIT